MIERYLPGVGEEPQLPSRDEFQKAFYFYFGNVYEGINPNDERIIRKKYEKAYKVLLALLSKGSKIDPMPASPEELPEPTEDNLAEVEACCGIYVFAVVGCLGRMAEVFLH